MKNEIIIRNSLMLLNKRFKGIYLFLFLLIVVSVSESAIIKVNPAGGHYPSIQIAVENSSPGDEIWVAEGIYYENIYIAERSNLLIKGGFNNDFTSRDIDIYPTEINGSYSAHTVHIRNSTLITIDGFKVCNGHDYNGGGFYIISGINNVTELYISHCTIVNNIADAAGGGFYSYSNNSGEIYTYFINNRVENNYANDSYDWGLGGGICVYAKDSDSLNSMYLEGIIIKSNNSELKSGGIHVETFEGSSISLQIISTKIDSNSSYNGGGIGIQAAYNSSITFTMEKTVLSGNTSTNYGGGIYAHADHSSLITMIHRNNLIVGNEAIGNENDTYGGGILALAGSNSEINYFNTHETYSDNSADYGGGLRIQTNSAQILCDLKNSIFWGNNAVRGRDISIYRTSGSPRVILSHSDIGDVYNRGGVFDSDGTLLWLDPQFVDSLNGNYRLSKVSPMIDSGLTSSTNHMSIDESYRPWDGDYDGQMITDIGAFEYIPKYIYHMSDFDADGKTDITVFRPELGQWIIKESSSGQRQDYYWGTKGDIPVPGDYNGGGSSDIAVFRPSLGKWIVKIVEDGSRLDIPWGNSLDTPVPGDYDGDGKTDVAIFRPSLGKWSIKCSSDGTRIDRYFGISSDYPIPFDYDGDGITDIAIFRPDSGRWILIQSSNQQRRDIYFGKHGDIPVPSDYDHDGIDEIGIFRPSNGSWRIRNLSIIWFGKSGDLPLPGNYVDGDVIIAVFRPAEGRWCLRNYMDTYWGISSDIPLGH